MCRALLVFACCVALSGCAALEGLPATATSPAARPHVEEAAPVAVTSAPKPASPAFIEERAQEAYTTGRWDVAEGYYLQWVHLKPGDAKPWFQLGNLYAEQGRLDSAERAYREALRRRDDARTLHNLGMVQMKLGIGAIRAAQKRLPPGDPIRQITREFLQTLLETTAQ
ncbi:MAG: tetratricopeptide repeat protein [Candidatus Competibacteraceae bacterium]